jgi:hypothetical protein
MLQAQTQKLMLTCLIAALCLLNDCGITAVAATSPSQTLQKSSDAMSKLNSFHVDFQSTENVHSSNGTSYNINGTADAAQNNQMAINLSRGSNPLTKVVSTGQTVYAQNGTGPWYTTSPSNLPNGLQQDVSQGLPASTGQFLSFLKNTKLADNGMETITNLKLDHITATLDAQSLRNLTTQINSMLPSQLQSNLNQIKQGVVDLWVDPTTSYLHQMKINASGQVDQNALPPNASQKTNGSTAVPVDAKGQLNFNKFNQPVNIQVPNNATPYPQS